MKKKPGNCAICRIWRLRLQRDHIIPKCQGGTNDPGNIQHLCANCHEDKTIKELIERQKGIPLTEERKKKIALAHIGLRPSEETRAKLRAAWKHRTVSDETRKKISLSLIGNKRALGTKRAKANG